MGKALLSLPNVPPNPRIPASKVEDRITERHQADELLVLVIHDEVAKPAPISSGYGDGPQERGQSKKVAIIALRAFDKNETRRD
jgi:hypothetical protein